MDSKTPATLSDDSAITGFPAFITDQMNKHNRTYSDVLHHALQSLPDSISQELHRILEKLIHEKLVSCSIDWSEFQKKVNASLENQVQIDISNPHENCRYYFNDKLSAALAYHDGNGPADKYQFLLKDELEKRLREKSRSSLWFGIGDNWAMSFDDKIIVEQRCVEPTGKTNLSK